MTVITEGNLEFTFDAGWEVLKYDRDGSYYKTQMEKNIKPAKAVDFLCHSADRTLLMLEVKDFRKGVPGREKFDKLPMTVAIKARDTIAGVIGGSHRASDGTERAFFQDSRRTLDTAPRVIFFFEDSATPARRPPGRAETKRNVLLKQLKKHLSWLTKDVAVVGLNDYDRFIADLKVESI